VMAVGESWLEEHDAPESVIGAWVAFKETIQHAEELLDRANQSVHGLCRGRSSC
jgi:hypothetical protein